MLAQARSFYSWFLDAHAAKDASRIKASLALKGSDADLQKLEDKSPEAAARIDVLHLIDLAQATHQENGPSLLPRGCLTCVPRFKTNPLVFRSACEQRRQGRSEVVAVRRRALKIAHQLTVTLKFRPRRIPT
jgi:hypothetical protein